MKILVIIIALWSMTSCSTKPIIDISEKQIFPIREGKEITLVYAENTNKKIDIRVGLLLEFINPYHYIEMKQGVNVKMYDSLGIISTEITANYAKRYVKENKMVLKHQVVIENETKQKLETEYLEWIGGEGMVYSDNFVKITDDGEVITGYGFEAKDDLSYYKIKKIQGLIDASNLEQ